MLVSMIGLVACNDKDKEPVLPENPSDNIFENDGRYEVSGMQEKIPMHPENFGDTLIVERIGDVYYVTVEVLNNESCERMYLKGRKKTRLEDSVIITNGKNTKYMFAFDEANVKKTIKLQIGGGRMPLDPPFEFDIEFDKLKRVGDADTNAKRPTYIVK